VYRVKLQVDSWDAETIEGNSSAIEKELFTYNEEKANRAACECLCRVVDGYYTDECVDLDDAKELFTVLVEKGEFHSAYELVRERFPFKIDHGESGCSIRLTCELLSIED